MINSRKWRAALKRLWQWDIAHLQPGQPLSWRFILPNQSPEIRLHRQLWWHSRYKLPGLLWLPLEVMRWLHWQLWAARQQVRKAVAHYGSEVQARFGISVAEQQRQIGYWAKAWCINPFSAYDWQLYQSERDGLAIIYDNQTRAYHALRNRKTGARKADHRLLSDKIALAEMLSAIGIPMVETARVSNGDWQDLLDSVQQYPSVFCKLRSGNQAESAFAVTGQAQALSGELHSGEVLADAQAVRNAWQVLAGKGEVLLQPQLHNHPQLAPASPGGSAITLRLVTQSQGSGIKAWWAELQVPAQAKPGSVRGFWRVPVAIEGTLSPITHDWFLSSDWQQEYEATWQALPALMVLPFWAEIVQHSVAAHVQLPNVWAIAWDWVLTPSGPVLLEGNSGWGLREMQQQGYACWTNNAEISSNNCS